MTETCEPEAGAYGVPPPHSLNVLHGEMMDPISIVLGMVNLLVAGLGFAVARPLMQGCAPIPGTDGCSWATLVSTQENKRKVLQHAGRLQAAWSVPIAIVGIVAFFVPCLGNLPLSVVIGLFPMTLIIPGVQSGLYARRLHQEELRQGTQNSERLSPRGTPR